MSKAKNKKEEIEVVETTETKEIVETTETVDIVKERMITCRAIKDHECTIGGVKYNLTKNKEYKLPVHVSIILARAQVVIQMG
jgi:hypothetical protein